MLINKRFTEELGTALQRRRIKQGIAMLDAAEPELKAIGPDRPESARLILLVAQWVDLGYRDYRFLDSLLAHFPAACRKSSAPPW